MQHRTVSTNPENRKLGVYGRKLVIYAFKSSAIGTSSRTSQTTIITMLQYLLYRTGDGLPHLMNTHIFFFFSVFFSFRPSSASISWSSTQVLLANRGTFCAGSFPMSNFRFYLHGLQRDSNPRPPDYQADILIYCGITLLLAHEQNVNFVLMRGVILFCKRRYFHSAKFPRIKPRNHVCMVKHLRTFQLFLLFLFRL